MLEASTNAPVVGGVHRYENGEINHSGGYILSNGIAGHFIGEISELSFVEYVCSAVMLVDIEYVKKNSIFFDMGYSKFFQETDFCFNIWESGGTVAITNKCDVTHLIGQVVSRMSNRIQLFNTDLRYFNKKWLSNGRLKSLLLKIESKFDKTYNHHLKELDILHTKFDLAVKNNDLSNQKKIVEMFKSYPMYDSTICVTSEFSKK